MTRCALSSCFEPLHIYHGLLRSPPSMMFFTCQICYHHEGVFRSLVQIHIWWWRKNGLAWVLTWLPFHASQGRWMFWRIGQSFVCIHTSQISTLVVVQRTANNVHSLEHLCDLIEDTFYHFDPEHLDQKLLQWKASNESPIDCWQRFHDL